MGWTKVKNSNTLCISKSIDYLELWMNIGSSSTSRFREIFYFLTIVSALLEANGFQERVFSIFTAFDHHLCQNMKPCRFEMLVLLAVKDGIMTKGVTSDKKAKIIVEKAVARCIMTPSFNVAAQFGIDPEPADFTVEDD